MSKIEANVRRPLRLWPGVAILCVQLALWLILPTIAPDAEVFGVPLAVVGVIGGLACAVLILLWWVLFSRAPWVERIGAVVVIAAAIAATRMLAHESVVGAHMGLSLYLMPAPYISLALVVWAVATQRVSPAARRAALVAAVVLACVPWTLIRTAGVMGAGSEYHWRWTPTPEERLLAQTANEPIAIVAPANVSAPAPAASIPAPAPNPGKTTSADDSVPVISASEAAKNDSKRVTNERVNGGLATTARDVARVEWPGFRGPERNSIVRGVEIDLDWSSSPPTQLWRHPIGPGWSSFAVAGDFIYTQEQRGDDELVSCYRFSTGEPVWRHADRVRFWESNGGAGPRGTPTVHDGHVYAFGATGILNALDAATGRRVWSRNVATDTGVEVPDWGFASSPIIVDDVVIIAASGVLAGYDRQSGDVRWIGPKGGSGYSSPHVITLEGVTQVLLLRGSRTLSVAPKTGEVLWEHLWQPGTGIVQPAVVGGDVLLTTGDAMGGVGVRRVAVTQSAGGWKAEERWTSRGLKPYFNDFVVHEGHAYGFDGSILAAIDLADGTRKWKGGRYGNGQMLLLADQGVLLVLSEEGELALVAASPDKFTELSRFPVLNAKTWNHPVVVGDVVLVRNGEEMAAFRLPGRR